MTLARAALTLLLFGVTTDCARSSAARACRHDSDCADNEVCFIDGCGDPGQGLAVEVTPTASNSGAEVQDFALISLGGTQDLELKGASSLQGDLDRAPQPASAPTPYTAPVAFRVNGRSTVIPDISRHFQSTLSTTVGTYNVALSAGLYTVIVEPTDPSVPPFVGQNVTVEAGAPLRLDVHFTPDAQLLKVHGVLLGDSAPVTGASLTVQALTPDAGLPVSQRSPVAASGEFALFVDPSVHDTHGYVIQAGPEDASGVAPKKLFAVTDVESLPDALHLGAFGAPTTLQGQVVGTDQRPLADITVYVEGTVGDGTFTSAQAHTDAAGNFAVTSLSPTAGSALKVIAVPPANSPYGTASVDLSAGAQASVSLVCPPRLMLQGQLLRPEGTPATVVPFTAEAVAAALPGGLLPPGANGATDGHGQFNLALEPGQYRLDFEPPDLPRLSRFITLVDASSTQLDALTLSKGRRVTGTITLAGSDPTQPVAFALVRYFRLGVESDAPSSVLLDETYADANGRYSVLLPTR